MAYIWQLKADTKEKRRVYTGFTEQCSLVHEHLAFVCIFLTEEVTHEQQLDGFLLYCVEEIWLDGTRHRAGTILELPNLHQTGIMSASDTKQDILLYL